MRRPWPSGGGRPPKTNKRFLYHTTTSHYSSAFIFTVLSGGKAGEACEHQNKATPLSPKSTSTFSMTLPFVCSFTIRYAPQYPALSLSVLKWLKTTVNYTRYLLIYLATNINTDLTNTVCLWTSEANEFKSNFTIFQNLHTFP